MSAEVETMFYVREKPWHGLGTNVEAALSSREALIAAGLNWEVVQEKLYTKDGDCVLFRKLNDAPFCTLFRVVSRVAA